MVSLPERQIVHLHSHTEYSLLDGVKNSKEFVAAAKMKGMDSYAITEHGNMSSAMGFYLEAIKPENNIKPIFGIEAYLVDDAKTKDKDVKSSHIVLLAKNNTGFENLLRLSNFSWGEGFYYKPRIDWKILKENRKGLIALTACMGGVLSNYIRYKDEKAVGVRLRKLKKIFGKNVYLEIQLHEEVYSDDFDRVLRKLNNAKGDATLRQKIFEDNKEKYKDLLSRHVSTLDIIPEYEQEMKKLLGDSWMDQATVNKYMIKLSRETNTKIVLTGDCHYPLKGDHKLQDLVIRVGFGNYKKARQGEDPKSASTGRGYYSSQLYIKDNLDFEKSRKRWHPYLPKKIMVEGILSTHHIADSIKTSIPIGQHQLPKFPIKSHPLYEEGFDSEKLFRKMVDVGFNKMIKSKVRSSELKRYKERIDFEFETIKQANFIDYFLIIEDIVRWSRDNGIYCVARGSVAGSIVAYAIDITGIDPIPYNLLFERFLNPTRVSGERAKTADALPDIDLDFERFGRSRVKQYIVDKYGKDRVLTIGSYGTMGVKMLVKDFAKVLDYKIGSNTYDYQIINKITSSVDIAAKTIEEACESSQEFNKFYEDNKGWFETYVRPLQGQIKSMSKHAAGVLITPTEFTKWVPVRTSIIEDEDDNQKIIISQWEDVYCERRGLLKLDVLGVKQLDVFHRCLELIKKRHNIDINLADIDINDKDVYKKFHAGDNFGVFQFNSNLQSSYMRRMKPSSIEDLCVSNALLRPGPMKEGAHEKFVLLKKGKESAEYDHDCVKPYLEATYGLMVYQEQTMQVAHVLGGLSLSEADMMRSAIKKKDEKLMTPFHEKFVDGCNSKGLSNKHANKVWDKIIAFSSYAFNKSHSATYALQGYYCQWLKTYFPNEFYAATMDFASDDAKKNENIYTHRIHASEEGIRVINPSVNSATIKFDVTKKGSIIWPLKAIKGVGEKAAVEIKNIQPVSSLKDFMERVNKRIVNKRVMTKLIPAGVFSEFGEKEDLIKKYFKYKGENLPEEYEGLDSISWKKIQDDTLGYICDSYKEVIPEFSKNIIKSYNEFLDKKARSQVIVGGLVSNYREILTRNKDKMCFLTIQDKNEKYEVVVFPQGFASMKDKPHKGCIVQVNGTKGVSPRGELQIIIGNPKIDKIYILYK